MLCYKRQKSEKEFDKLTFGNSDFTDSKFNIFTCPVNSVSTFQKTIEIFPLLPMK